MLRIIERIVDGVTQVVLPSCVWGGEVITPGRASGGNAGRTSPSFRLQMEVLEPRYALSVSVGPDPLAVEEPLDFDPALDAEYELRAEGDAADQTIDNGQELSVEASPAAVSVFVVTSTKQNDRGTWDVYAQRQDAGGNPIADPIRVSETSNTTPDRSSAAMSDAGKFVVVWSSRRDDEVIAIFARSYHADGSAVSEEVQASETTLKDSQSPVAAIAEDGKFVVAWSGKSEPDTTAIFARPFDSSGQAVSDEIGVFFHAGGEPHELATAINSEGQFAVAWSGTGPDEAEGVFVQQYRADGSANGGVIQASSSAHVGPGSLELVIEDDGTAMVFWFDLETGTTTLVRIEAGTASPAAVAESGQSPATRNVLPPAHAPPERAAAVASTAHSDLEGQDDGGAERSNAGPVSTGRSLPLTSPADRRADLTAVDLDLEDRVGQLPDSGTPQDIPHPIGPTKVGDASAIGEPVGMELPLQDKLDALSDNPWLDADHGGETAPVNSANSPSRKNKAANGPGKGRIRR